MFENSVGQCFVHQVILNNALNTFTNRISRVPCMLQTNICILQGQFYELKNTYFTPFFKKRLGNTCCAFNYVGGCNGN